MQNGFTYEYATGSDLAGALTVDVTVVKDFYQVRFYGGTKPRMCSFLP